MKIPLISVALGWISLFVCYLLAVFIGGTDESFNIMSWDPLDRFLYVVVAIAMWYSLLKVYLFWPEE